MTRIAIFGATSAIAEHVARLYAERHADLCLIARDREKLDMIARDLTARGANTVVIKQFDFSALKEIPNLLQEIVADFQVPERVLIAYGTLPDQVQSQADLTRAQEALTINFVSPSLLTLAVAQLMQPSGGSIGIIGSVAGDRGRASNFVYGAAKGGLALIAQGLAHSLARTSVGKPLTVALFKPGFVDTPMTANFAKGPLWAKPGDVAQIMYKALESGRSGFRYTPFFWRFVMLIIRGLPQALIHRTGL